jgi:hypothetical protein
LNLWVFALRVTCPEHDGSKDFIGIMAMLVCKILLTDKVKNPYRTNWVSYIYTRIVRRKAYLQFKFWDQNTSKGKSEDDIWTEQPVDLQARSELGKTTWSSA